MKIKKKKFTLVEILAAMAVFMIAIAPLLGLLMRTTKMHTDNLKKIKAQMLAKDELARLSMYKNTVNFENAGSLTAEEIGTTANFERHVKYNGLYYCVTSDDLPNHYNLVKFNLYICYTNKSQADESYELFVAKAE